MSNMFCINKSGSSIPVYSDTSFKTKVGTLGNREAYVLLEWETFPYIYFRGPDLELIKGSFKGEDYYANSVRFLESYPYGTATIDGTKYKTYLMKKTMNVYTAAANYWGKVASGMLVATNSSTCGSSHPTWKAVNYVKSTAGNWVKVEGDGYSHGFVNFDLGNGSMPSNIALYGSW